VPLFRIVLSVLLAGAAAILTATPALAHTVLKSSTPANGASLDTAPDTVTLTFEEAVSLPANAVSITGPDGAAWAVGAVTTSGASVTAPVQATGPAGQYTLRYSVIADDGDAVKGTVTFTMTAAATATTSAGGDAASAEAQATAPAAPVAAAPATAAPGTAAPASAAAGSDSGTSAWAWVAVAIVVLGVAGGLAVATWRRRAGSGRRTS
jgi:methionine-rich copper-binding protein CopC